MCALTIAIACASRRQQGGRLFPFAFLLFCVFLGALHSKNYLLLPRNHISLIQANSLKPLSVSGIIDSDPAQSERKISFILKAKEAAAGNKSCRVGGKILANVFPGKDFSYGDKVVLEGALHRPFNYGNPASFSYRDYLRNQGIYSIFSVKKGNQIAVLSRGRGNYLKSLAFKMKRRARDIFERYLWPVNSAVLAGIILGERQNIPDDIRQSFIRTGTSHIIAISGFNVGLVVFMALILLKAARIKRKIRYVLAIPILIIHMLGVGASSSVVRATIMAMAVLAGYLLERETNIVNSLSLSALIILGYNPMQLFDAGFQLSFISVLGIVLLSPRIIGFSEKIFSRLKGIRRFCLNGFAVSLSAWLATLGLIAHYFRIISPVTLLANLIIVPLTSLIILLGFSLSLSAVIWPGLAGQIAATTNLTMAVLFKITSGLSQLPFAYFYL